MSDTKVCGSCHQELPTANFNKRAASKDGLAARCRSCGSSYNKARNARRKTDLELVEADKSRKREWERDKWASDPHYRERRRLQSLAWKRSNPDRVRQYDESRRQDPEYQEAQRCLRRTPEYRAESARRMREWRTKNPDAARDARARYYWTDPERGRERRREWVSNNPDLARAAGSRRRARLAGLPHEPWSLEEIIGRDLESYGFVSCWMCGVELCDEDRPHLDHLIPVAADPQQLEALGVENPGDVSDNLELACGKCNRRKQHKVMLCAVARYLRNASHTPDELPDPQGSTLPVAQSVFESRP